ncbi:extracellular solute-binding protein, partial [Rhizobium ruizarguesonis]
KPAIEESFHTPPRFSNSVLMTLRAAASPTGAHGESWIFYSKEAFEKAGISQEPKTWDELFADLDKMKAAGIIPVAWGGKP